MNLSLLKVEHEVVVEIVIGAQFDGLNVIGFADPPHVSVIVDDSRMGDAVQPGQQWDLAILVADQALDNAQEHLGGQILGCFGITDPVQDIAIDVMNIGIIKFAKRLLVPTLRRADERLFSFWIHSSWSLVRIAVLPGTYPLLYQ